ncbi:hypothetical protein DVH24_014158 [Malus domestica]|uniref:Uncharacterized protein n=1 Tax=Malus domestica TaxID=3750 RepID=A0A498JIR4_MALDO|nr:hypothetical protein DVH24_014158 [Malus domestica]
MEELGLRIGSNLMLLDKERKGIVIGKKEVEEACLVSTFVMWRRDVAIALWLFELSDMRVDNVCGVQLVKMTINS